MIILFILFTIFCPLFFWVGADSRLAQQVFFQIFGTSISISTFMFFDRKAVNKSKVSLWLGIFGIYTFLLFMLGGCKVGASTMLNTFVACMLYCSTLYLKKEDTSLLLKTVLWVCVINVAYMFFQQIGFDFIFNMRGAGQSVIETQGELIGFFGLKSHMGIYMALGMIVMLYINPWLAILFIPLLYISKSIGAIAGAFIGVLFWFWWTKRKVAYFLLPILLAFGIWYVVKVDNPMGMMKTRPGVWKTSLKDVVYGYNLHDPKLQSPYLRNIFTGFGPEMILSGNLYYLSEPLTDSVKRGIRTPNGVLDEQGKPFLIEKGELFTNDKKPVDLWDNLHNGLIQLFYEYGLLGMIIIGFLVFYISKLFRESFKSKELVAIMSMILVLLVSSITQFPLYVARIGYLMPILLGLFVINLEE